MADRSCQPPLWGDGMPSTSSGIRYGVFDAGLAGVQPNTEMVVDDSQPEPEPEPTSWQLGGLASAFLVPPIPKDKEEPSLVTAVKSEEGKPATSASDGPPVVRKRGRPPYASLSRGDSPAMASNSGTCTPKKLLRKLKSKKKRLTMPKGGGVYQLKRVVSNKTSPNAIHPSVPKDGLTDGERTDRMTQLIQNCPEEVSKGLKDATVVVESMIREAEAYRNEVKKNGKNMKALDEMTVALAEETKARQIKQDTLDLKITQAICQKFLTLETSKENGEEAVRTFFTDGPSDSRIHHRRNLLSLPPLVDMLTLDPAVIQKDPFEDEGAKVVPSNEQKDGTDTRELTNKLYAMLGRPSLSTHKRHLQRAKRAKETENLTEEQVNKSIDEYFAMCRSLTPRETIQPEKTPYHSFKDYKTMHCTEADEIADCASAIEGFLHNFVHPCSCRGNKKCSRCLDVEVNDSTCRLPLASNVTVPSHAVVYDFCPQCQQAFPMSGKPVTDDHSKHARMKAENTGVSFELAEVKVHPDRCSAEEENALIRLLNKRAWMEGQGGCFRQDYGPVVDYQTKEVDLDSSTGLPQFLQHEIIKISRMYDSAHPFPCASVSVMDLTSERASAIQPREEDEWIWGERVILMALTSDVVITLSPQAWDGVSEYRIVRLRIPRRGQIVLQDDVRHEWSWSVLSADIREKQVLVVFREINEEFVNGASAEIGKKLMEINEKFSGEVIKMGDGY
ncbi:hypothetical protein RvY_14859 [Ramazzottius varieornatus]|uniref:Uncharacterized protein n=1 Tax=Ramazzottius varieornatus TaxID=947166 RepID=A0A1D1VSS2_RAMVA|nr:hypothetical protein RvY_14859 [Ramazzottius varieornatus]